MGAALADGFSEMRSAVSALEKEDPTARDSKGKEAFDRFKGFVRQRPEFKENFKQAVMSTLDATQRSVHGIDSPKVRLINTILIADTQRTLSSLIDRTFS